jgi:metallo-beta-lactamase class B
VLNDRVLLQKLIGVLAAAFLATSAHAANDPCPSCATWNAPQQPFKVFANTYYVGPHGLSSILITSSKGHILIDGALPESAPQIAERIQALGFRLQDIKLILNSHAHFDHAGGIAELQKLSGAQVAALAPSAKVLEQGYSDPNDPQYGQLPPIAKVKSVRVVKNGETVRVGDLALTAHATPGHTPGSTSWTWKSCEGSKCLNLVYADSLSAVSADTFKFSSSKENPTVVADFEKSFATVAAFPCDILLTPHPDVSGVFERADQGFVDTTACKRYAESAKERLKKRLADEAAAQ